MGYLTYDNEVSHWSLFNGAIAVTGLTDFVDSFEQKLQVDAATAA
jgi:hypothetical protein